MHMRKRPSDEGEMLDAAGAARFLGVKPATLYAYVSRGWCAVELAARGGSDNTCVRISPV